MKGSPAQLALLAVSLILPACVQPEGDGTASFTQADATAIQQTMESYRDAWMAGDSANVVNKLSEHVRMFRPDATAEPLIGKKQLTEFWFPPSDVSYPIYEYRITDEEIQGSGHLAFLQGISHLSWCTLESGVCRDSTTNVSEYLTVLRKEEGSWKIFRQIYNVKDADYAR